MGRKRGENNIFKEAVLRFSADDALTLGAALAFYSALSLAPLLVLLLWMGSFIGDSTQENLTKQIVALLGPQAGATITSIVDNAKERPTLGNIAGLVSVITLLLSATGVFGQLQHALDIIWGVTPKLRSGFWSFIRKRILSAGMVLAFGFLFLVSLTLSAALSAALNFFEASLPGGELLWMTLNAAVPFLVFWLLFSLLFRYLPDIRIAWMDVWFGGGVTSLLFVIGKTVIGIYLGEASVGSAYGAAGSLVALLVWVYYSSLILFLGAELTQIWAQRRGRAIGSDQYASAGNLAGRSA